MAEAQKVTILAESSGEDDKDEPPAKTPRLYTGYRKKKNKKDHHVSSVKAELIHYIQVCSDEEEEADCLGFWKRNAKVFPRLYLVAMRVLSVPATIAPVDCSWRPYNAPSLSQTDCEDTVQPDLLKK